MKNYPTITLVAFIVLCGCTRSSYFAELDPRAKSVNSSKYGKGKYFYHYSKFIFPSENAAQEKEDYFNFAQTEIAQKIAGNQACTIIPESLSYYGEGGVVSVLVKCNET
ncbi:hypothetical protein JAO78_012265 [Alishewanella sp. 16-MA]|uniref:Lipoprotein n=1 Tax=Alishewanella maricola TaxID=2795740 RepID=A0ABS8C5G4_9ALTE|nr:hypothetical protein [Alishewanella maricola]MCB5227586.1 hypothetical protein [Alishewanella maricola]